MTQIETETSATLRPEIVPTSSSRLQCVDRGPTIPNALHGALAGDRIIGQTTMYTVDWDDPAAKRLKQFQTELLE